MAEQTPLIRWAEDTESEASLASRSRSRSPPRPVVASAKPEKVKKEEVEKGKGKGEASGSTGVWTEAAGQDRARVLVDRDELHALVEDVRVVLHNAERVLKYSSEA